MNRHLKLLMAAVAFVGFASVSMAQTVNLKVEQQELALIGKGLSSLPYGEVAPLMTKLQAQVIEQQKAEAPKPEVKEPAKGGK